jgi:tetratricopeptide (TPR) repeat protein
VLITTQEALVDYGSCISISGFTRAESVAYLQQRTEVQDETGADRVAEALGDLPVALAAAGYLIDRRNGNLTYAEYLDQLREEPIESTLPQVPSLAYKEGVVRAISLALRAAAASDPSALAHRVIAALSVLDPAGATVALLDDIAGDPVHPALSSMVRRSLLTWGSLPNRSVIMHRLTARVSRDQLEQGGLLWLPAVAASAGMVKRLRKVPGDPAVAREEAFEILRHTRHLWDSVVPNINFDTIPDNERQFIFDLGHRAVRYAGEHADYDQALHLALRVCSVAEVSFGRSSSISIRARDDLASAYKWSGDFSEAVSRYEALVTDVGAATGTDSQELLAARNSLGQVYFLANRNTEAISLLEQTFSDSVRLFGEDHQATLYAANSLAGSYRANGDYRRAVELYRDVVRRRESNLGPSHPETLTAYNNLGFGYQAYGQPEAAVPLHARALAGRARLFGENHPETLGARLGLASAHLAAGETDTGIQIYRAVLAEAESAHSVNHASALRARNDLGTALLSAGNTEGLDVYERNLEIATSTLGHSHPHASIYYDNFASACLEVGDIERLRAVTERLAFPGGGTESS